MKHTIEDFLQMDENEIFRFIGRADNDTLTYMVKQANTESARARVLIYFANKLMYSYVSLNYDGNDIISKLMTLLECKYYKTLVVEAGTFRNYYSIEEITKSLKRYDLIKDKLEGMTSEEDRAKYIAGLDDNDMKLSLLDSIKERKNRDIVIKSFKGSIDARIKPTVELAKDMILEYFEDNLGSDFTEEQKERIEIAFRRVNIGFDSENENTRINATIYYASNTIAIARKNEHDFERLIGVLIHEFSHLLSRFEFKFKPMQYNTALEEGMSDVFADLVVNSYLLKHGKIVINGENMELKKPYKMSSAYSVERKNAEMLLYKLCKKGEEAGVLAKYILGDEEQYCKMMQQMGDKVQDGSR